MEDAISEDFPCYKKNNTIYRARQECGSIPSDTWRTLTAAGVVKVTAKSQAYRTLSSKVGEMVRDVIIISERPYRKPAVSSDKVCECPAGFVKHKCQCYLFESSGSSDDTATAANAQKQCQKHQAYLTSIVTQEEMVDLKHFLQTVWLTDAFDTRELRWIYIGLGSILGKVGNANRFVMLSRF
jgi:hypothetical protein